MAIPTPTIQLGGSAGWITKEGALLGVHYDSTKEIYKPIKIGAARNSAGWRINRAGIWERKGDNYPRIMFDENPVSGEYINEPLREQKFVNPLWSGGVSGSPGTSPTFWSAYTDGGSITFSNSLVKSNALKCRFIVSGQRYHLQQNVSVTNGEVYFLTFNLEVITGTTLGQIASVAGVTANRTYYVDGVSQAASYTPPAGNYKIGVKIEVTSTGAMTIRLGTGCSSSDTADVAIELPNISYGDYGTTLIPEDDTRAADSVSQSNLGHALSQISGVIYHEFKTPDVTTQSDIGLTGINSSIDRINLRITSGNLAAVILIDGVVVVSASGGALSPNTLHRAALRYESGKYAISLDGAIVATSANSASFSDGDLVNFHFNSALAGITPFYGRSAAVANLPTMTDADLNELTTNGLP